MPKVTRRALSKRLEEQVMVIPSDRKDQRINGQLFGNRDAFYIITFQRQPRNFNQSAPSASVHNLYQVRRGDHIFFDTDPHNQKYFVDVPYTE